MYMSQEMPNLRRFLARFLLSDNQMTIILEIIYWIENLNIFCFFEDDFFKSCSSN